VKVTVCPPGEALGARDLQQWASRRSAGLSGTFVSKSERKQKQKRREDRADHWLRGAERRNQFRNSQRRNKT
jgi:hypothetical protein